MDHKKVVERRPEISHQVVVCVTAAKIAFLELKVGS